MKQVIQVLLVGYLLSALPPAAVAFEQRSLQSVVRVIPLWPGQLRGGEPGTPPGSAPEGTAITVLPGGFLATALHVVDCATEITVLLDNGREVMAQFVAGDAATDIALLRIAEELAVLEPAPEPALGAEVCAVGNQFGLGLSVTCGVVSANRRNRFIQFPGNRPRQGFFVSFELLWRQSPPLHDISAACCSVQESE